MSDETRGPAERTSPRILALSEIAELVGGRVEGEDLGGIVGVSALADAGPDELGFLASRRYLKEAGQSKARAFLVSEEAEVGWVGGRSRVVVPDGHKALRLLLDHLHPEVVPGPAIHPSAVVHPSALIGRSVSLGAYAVVEEGAIVGDRTRIGSHVVVGRDVRIGPDCLLHPHVVLYDRTVLGSRVIVHAGAKIGVDGFGYVFEEGRHRKVRQVGSCEVSDDVEIGANTCIDRGSIGRTVIGPGAKLDNQVHIAHNVHVGENSLLTAGVGIAGSTRIGKGVVFGGQSGATGHLRIGDGVQVSGKAGVASDIPAGQTVMGFPARPKAEVMKAYAASFKMDGVIKNLRSLVRRVSVLEERGVPRDGPDGEGASDGTPGS